MAGKARGGWGGVRELGEVFSILASVVDLVREGTYDRSVWGIVRFFHSCNLCHPECS